MQLFHCTAKNNFYLFHKNFHGINQGRTLRWCLAQTSLPSYAWCCDWHSLDGFMLQYSRNWNRHLLMKYSSMVKEPHTKSAQTEWHWYMCSMNNKEISTFLPSHQQVNVSAQWKHRKVYFIEYCSWVAGTIYNYLDFCILVANICHNT